MGRPAAKPLVHLELHTGDLARARRFYEEHCGWSPVPVRACDASYLALETGGGVGGGIVECPAQRALWLPYVEVADVRQATERARLSGASVLLGPREGPAGWRSVVRDRAGGELAFWQPKR